MFALIVTVSVLDSIPPVDVVELTVGLPLTARKVPV